MITKILSKLLLEALKTRFLGAEGVVSKCNQTSPKSQSLWNNLFLDKKAQKSEQKNQNSQINLQSQTKTFNLKLT